ncbi:MAG TPA: alpha/beta hydrolase [Polyangiaceae bacterium]|nr:alpha/beta hydrolase [Polyangiaceae bacterium]
MFESRQETVAGGGGSLFVRSWSPTANARAILAICPGFNSHSGYYAWVGSQCAGAGYVTYALDLRGRGKSAGERYYVETFDEYVSDVHTLVNLAKRENPALPLFLLGHSAGGVVSCLYALDHGSELSGLICEDFAFELPAPDFALAVLKGVSHLAPHAHALTLKHADFSRDPKVVEAMSSDPLIAHESQPFATAAAIVRADERLKQNFSKLKTPLLIIHGSADQATKPSGSQHFYERTGAMDKTLKLYEGRYHDPLNDLGKEEVMSDILRWLHARAAAR